MKDFWVRDFRYNLCNERNVRGSTPVYSSQADGTVLSCPLAFDLVYSVVSFKLPFWDCFDGVVLIPIVRQLSSPPGFPFNFLQKLSRKSPDSWWMVTPTQGYLCCKIPVSTLLHQAFSFPPPLMKNWTMALETSNMNPDAASWGYIRANVDFLNHHFPFRTLRKNYRLILLTSKAERVLCSYLDCCGYPEWTE